MYIKATEEAVDKLPTWVAATEIMAPKASWSLYEVEIVGEEEDSPFLDSLEWLSGELADLLTCSKLYPPAYVIALLDSEEFDGREEDVLPFLTQRLRHYMEHQRDDGFTLAKALRDDGEIIKGWFYWVIRYDVTRDVVSYISTDYYCYSCSADIFGLSPQELVLLKPYVQNGA